MKQKNRRPLTLLPRVAIFKLIALIITALGMASEAQAQLKVSVMPSHTQSSSYAKAGLNEAIAVWGRAWGGTGALTYTLDFGDGTAAATGSVTNANYIGASHTYTTGGLKTFTLTVTDSTSTSVSRSGVIRVIAGPVHADRVHMAIERGLMYLYRNYTVLDANRIYWSWQASFGHDYDVGSTSSSLLAFEENDHLPGEDDVEEIYAETIRRGLNTLFSLAVSHNIGSAQHSDGIAVRDTDSNNNNLGIYLNTSGGHRAYSTPFAGMAIILAKRNSAEAQASTVPYGTFAGTNYLTFVQDMVDQMHWTQGDGSYRGGYGYEVATQSQTRFDGSSQQWPALMLLAAEERLGIHTPQWWLDNAANGFNVLQAGTGGIGYSDANGWRNVAKTGGALALYAFAGRLAGADANATAARNYVQNLWTANPSWGGDQAGWTGQWYAMWALKKGLQLQGITTLQTGAGARSWKQDMQAWLLGNATLLDSQGTGVPANTGYRTTSYMFGQSAEGRWVSAESPGSNGMPIDTAHGVLILSEAVTRPVPVAVIAAVGSQSNRAGSRAFDMDGSGSYHLDSNASVIEYLWDWNASDGVDWNNPDASGPRPTNPGYATVGNYTVTLRVKDNQDPSETATATLVVNVVNTDIAPVAVAIPASRLPAYSGKVGQPIQLDGTASYDPDDDSITLYSWDTDGNGTYGDATGPNPTLTYNEPHVGQIGLRVTANGVTSTNSAVADIYATPNDFYVQSISTSNLVVGVSADVEVVFKNAIGSEGVWPGVTVRFYNGDPLGNGVQIGSNYTVNLPSEGTATLNASLTGLNGAELVYVYIDAARVIPEWDEGNNTASVNVATRPEIAIEQPAGTDLTDGTASIDFGSMTQGLPAPLSFRILNTTGTAALSVGAITFDGANPGDFSVTTAPPATVAIGAFADFVVTFTPQSVGSRSAVMHIANSDGNENPFDITLNGTGLTPEIAVYSGSHTMAPELSNGQGTATSFGTTAPNSASILSFLLRNTGAGDLVVSGITLPAGFQSSAVGTTLAPGSTYMFQISLKSDVAGSYSGNVVINNNDLDEGSFTFPVSGSIVATGSAPVINISTGNLAVQGTGGSSVLGGAVGSTLYSYVGAPAINSSGVLASSVVIRNSDGSLHNAMMVGQPLIGIASDTDAAADLPGVNYFSFGPPVINEAGNIAFTAEVRGAGIVKNTNSRCLFSNASDGVIKLVAQVGMNVGLGSPLAKINTTSISGDLVIFLGSLADNRIVLMGWDANTGLRSFVRTGQSITANGISKTVKSFNVLETTNASSGHGKELSVSPTGEVLVTYVVAFTDNTFGVVYGSFDGSNDNGFGMTYGASRQLADTYAGAAAVVPLARWNTFRSPSFDNTGSYYGFISQMATDTLAGVTIVNNVGVFADLEPGQVALQLREDSQAPGTPAGVVFSDFSDLVLGGADYEFLVKADLRGPGVTATNLSGLWAKHSDDGIVLVAREGSAAPGVTGGTFSKINQIALPGTAQPIFQATLTAGVGGVVSTNDTGLWVINNSKNLVLAVREGDVIDVGGTNRTVTAITALINGTTTGGALGRRVFLVDGQLTLLLSFSGGVQTHVKVVVP